MPQAWSILPNDTCCFLLLEVRLVTTFEQVMFDYIKLVYMRRSRCCFRRIRFDPELHAANEMAPRAR